MITTTSGGTTPQVVDPPSSSIQIRLFLIRDLAAIVWAAAFAIVGASVTTAVTVAAGVLLVLYPLIDLVGSLIDARNQQGPGQALIMIALYAATGGVDFIIQAWLLVRRLRLATTASPLRSAS